MTSGSASVSPILLGDPAAGLDGDHGCGPLATPEPGQSLLAALDAWRRKAEGRAVVHYGFRMALREAGDTTLAELACLTRDEGVTSFKPTLQRWPPRKTGRLTLVSPAGAVPFGIRTDNL